MAVCEKKNSEVSTDNAAQEEEIQCSINVHLLECAVQIDHD